ncbi:MAG: aminotransferase class V-fold PLP-dependent enzyme [Acidimicrobiia bacterium]|nr:aminotransferase class V-fold PLP-dependent enzyme [Acidimicrobiia bacterium]
MDERSGRVDVARLRADTPGVHHVIHLNNAGAALMPRPVIEAVVDHIELEGRIGGYEAADAASKTVADAYEASAELLGVDPREIAIVESATVAWDRIVYSLDFREGDRILTTTSEYGSNWAAYLQLADRRGVEVVMVPDDQSGDIDIAALEALVDERTRLISINHVPTNGGLVNPAAAVGVVARRAGVPFLLDACQSVGHLPLDLRSIGCTFATWTSRKFLRGPRGVGGAFVASEALDTFEPVFADNHSTTVTDMRYRFRNDARRLESWERSYANLVGYRTAVRYALDVGVEAIWCRVRELAAMTREGLRGIEGVTVLDRGTVQGAIVTFTIDGRYPVEVQELLGEAGINASHSTINSAPFDMRMRGLDGLVRIAVHAYNTEDEIDRFLTEVRVISAVG